MTVTLDMMEYANDGAAQAAYVSSALPYLSNANIDDEDMADISEWADVDEDTGVSSQVTFDGQSCMKLESGTGATFAYAGRQQDVGAFGARTVVSARIYFASLGTQAAADIFQFAIHDGSTRCDIRFASDGIFVYDGVSMNEVGVDLVVQDVWQKWTLDIDWSAKTVDVYLNEIIKGNNIDCSVNDVTTNGMIVLAQYGLSRAESRISYVDWFKAGSDFISGLQCYSEGSIKTQGDYSLKGIAVQAGSLNETLTRTI